ncbi:MAG: VIT1/CCC1 transporter family protein [Firmicutes bacterium]|jgi:VIT1/CCC1 family predicted Fe2+/Mn2+ transporter|uniref:Iron transporter n=1 Tax=Sulfobacillus benefaciens TaxID=453960 RepID=A0A2T2XA78_9FIRM|nr:VIT1/CCC1 transporter family protein [Bacillota bacterium]MCL5015561.1 VIT1/CCC1 transporter family protein [Bacillota bacterium]PSR31421.1 MAG: iron transporter [Sulfobacillus benefaciens]
MSILRGNGTKPVTAGEGNKPRKLGLNLRVLLREAIFGVNDGLVATVGLVSGEALSHQPHGSIVIAGLSSVGAAMVSMSMGSYLATTSQNDWVRQQIREQRADIQDHPHQEAHEVRELLEEIGIPDREIAGIRQDIISSRPRWLKFMIREALGVHPSHHETPLANAVTMAIAVAVGSSPPILPFLLPLPTLLARDLAWFLSLMAALTVGAIKGRLTGSPVVVSSLQFGVLASLSAAVGAGIGWLLGLAGT